MPPKAPKNNLKPTVKSLKIKGTSGLSRRQMASLRVTPETFPGLPRNPSSSFITKPRDESMATYASAAAGRVAGLRASGEYLSMLCNPFVSVGQRYPDESIVPSALLRLTTSTTYTVDATGASNGFFSALNWKLRTASVPGNDSTYYAPTSFGTAPTYRDYGTPQSSWAALSTVDRTLACAIRVRHTGLPVSTFIPSGTLYFLQLQTTEAPINYTTEQSCVAAVLARKGFSLTVAELSRLGGAVHIPYLPQGPMSYVFSGPTDAASYLPDSPPGSNSTVAANGGLAVFGFGLQAGNIFRFDYAHHVEYIPGVSAAGLVETRVATPSVVQREAIAEGAASVHRLYGGGTTANSLAVLANGGNVLSSLFPSGGSTFGRPSGGAGSAGTLGSMVETLGGLAGYLPKLAGIF